MDELVEALEEGKIVKVREEYAKREGLLILRKDFEKPIEKRYLVHNTREKKEEERIGFDELRKPLNWRKNQVVSELIDNFQWVILQERKKRNLTRKQFAGILNVSENEMKMIENGIVNDFVLINKIQSHFGINLRKDEKDFSASAREVLEKKGEKNIQEDIEIEFG